MLFNSFRYLLVFLPIVVVGCILIKDFLGARAAQAWILFASLVFYGWSKPTDLIYLAASILANWLIARWIGQTQDPDRKRILVFGVVLNIAYLCVFKYLGFFASMALPVLPSRFHLPDLAFPLGVSFFTVTQIMYLVDCYESILPPGTLFDHMSFVAFFPYLISGPLGRAERMRHQLGNFGGTREDRGTLLARGIYHFSIGLVKKTVFASGFAQIANYGSSSVPHPHALEEWIFGFSYMLELYFDFSGYSDMAIGSATMLGIHIPRNFDAPLRSLSIIEFWTRWHISLSDFITTYLYTPILKSFESATLRTSAIATMLAMTIAGFWHGPSWNFVVFGLIHGVALATNQYWKKLFKKRKGKRNIVLPDFVCWAADRVCRRHLHDLLLVQHAWPGYGARHGSLQRTSCILPGPHDGPSGR